MPERRARVGPRLRLALLALAGVFALAVAAALVAVYVFLQPERFTAMLRQQASDAGLVLNLASPAQPTLFPRPALELHGLTLAAAGASRPILYATRGRLALPWRTLLGGPTVISRLEIDAPRVDLDAMQAWLAALPPGASGAPPEIPRVATGVRITRGTLLRGNRLLLSNFSLETGSLLSGRPFALGMSAQDPQGTPMQLDLLATPRIAGSALQLGEVHLDFSYGDAWALKLRGQAHWHGAADASADLGGTLVRQGGQRYDVALALTPADQTDPLLLKLKLGGPGLDVDLALPPLAWGDWSDALSRQGGPQLAVPPADGTVRAAQLDLEGVHIEGLQIRAGSAAAPAPAGSTPAPGR